MALQRMRLALSGDLDIPDFRPDPTGNWEPTSNGSSLPTQARGSMTCCRSDENFSTDHAALLERYVDYRRNATARGEAFMRWRKSPSPESGRAVA